MPILLNIGNTHTQVARWSAGTLTVYGHAATSTIRSEGWEHPLLRELPREARLVGACVVPDLIPRLAACTCRQPISWLDGQLAQYVAPTLNWSAVDLRTVGADRLANVIAAATLLALPALVLDCGTALNTVVVGPGPAFLGGAILPGRALARQALHRGTGQLPVVPLSDTLPAALGTRTVDALRAGIDLGIVGAVTHLLATTRAELGGAPLTAVAIGGDRAFFAAHVPGLTLGPDDFTLRGLAAVADAG